jgi:trk system potassium uptake protein
MDKRTVSGYPLIVNYLGIFSILIGLILLVPLIVIMFRPQEIAQLPHFIIPSLIAISSGGAIVFYFKGREKGHLERNQDAILVVLIWMMAIFYSALPFSLSGTYSLTQGVFEATSGFSTTGLTVVDVSQAPHVLLFFRSVLQFVGGVGLVLVLTSAVSDKFGMRLYNAEGHSDKLMPNLIRSARMILSIYVGYITLGMLAYMAFGMPFFEALNHAICAVATGGFSTNAASIGAYDSLAIEIITIVLMILGGTNFFVHLMLLRGKLKNVFRHIEIKLLGILILIFLPMLIISVRTAGGETFGQSVRIGTFQFFSAITGTGYQTIPSFNPMPETFMFVLIILMVLGAGMGSTAGGMKQYRVALAFKSFFWSVKNQLSHRKTIRTRFINKLGTNTVVEKEDIVFNYSFLMTYVMVLLTGTLIFTAFGYTLRDSMFEFASALGTVGLSVGITGAHAHPLILWTSTFGMFFGRLEFFVIFVAISKVVLDVSKKKIM